MSDSPRIFKIPTHRLSIFTEKFATLQRKAARLGCPVPESTVGPVTYEKVTDTDIDGESYTHYVEFYPVTVSGEAPRLNGWAFAAVVDYEAESPVFRKTPALGDVELPERYRSMGPVCEHCRQHRARTETFIVIHEDGRFCQVGRQCLKDFLGHHSPEHLAILASFEADVRALCEGSEDGGMSLGGGSFAPDLVWYLAWVVMAISRWGWLSRRAAGDYATATADVAAIGCRDYIKAVREGRADRTKAPTKIHEARAVEIVEWARALGSDGVRLSDYQHNLRAICQGSIATPKNHGLIASAVVSYDIEQARRRQINNEHVGTVGDVLKDVRVYVDRVLAIPMSAYGGSRILMRDLAGHVYTWVTNAAHPTMGKEYALSGTIKGHNEFRGVKQTVMTRAELQADDEPTKFEKAFAEMVNGTLIQVASKLTRAPFGWSQASAQEFSARRTVAAEDTNLVELDALRLELREIALVTEAFTTTETEARDAEKLRRCLVIHLDRRARSYEAPKLTPKVKAMSNALTAVITTVAHLLRSHGFSDHGALVFAELAELLPGDLVTLTALRDELRERVTTLAPQTTTWGAEWQEKANAAAEVLRAEALAVLNAEIKVTAGATFSPKVAEKAYQLVYHAATRVENQMVWDGWREFNGRLKLAGGRADVLALHALRDELAGLVPLLPLKPGIDPTHGELNRAEIARSLVPEVKKARVTRSPDVAT